MSSINRENVKLFQNKQLQILIQRCYIDPIYHNDMYNKSSNNDMYLNISNIEKYVGGVDDIVNDIEWWCSIFKTNKVACYNEQIYNKLKDHQNIEIIN